MDLKQAIAEDEGFLEKDLGKLIEMYDLRCCFVGPQAGRLIMPIYEDDKLIWDNSYISEINRKLNDKNK